jgi:predicted transcriptional regulator
VTLTDGELRLMRVLWERGSASVSEVRAALAPPHRPAYNTVLTELGILERKGYVRHTKNGRAFVYEPVVDRERVRRSAVRRLVSQLFDGSAGSLAVSILQHERVDQAEIAFIRRLLDEEA